MTEASDRLTDAYGTNHVRHIDGPDWEGISFWSVDGATIYVQSEPTEGANQWVAAVPADGGEVRRLLETSDELFLHPQDPGNGELVIERFPAVNRYLTLDVGARSDAAGGG